MTPEYFAQTILTQEPNVVDAISTGAGWEVWLQVELLRSWRQQVLGGQGGREVQYPDPYGREHVDLVLVDHDTVYAIELKVEGAGRYHSTSAFEQAAVNDAKKLQRFELNGFGHGDRTVERWVVGVAYTPRLKDLLSSWQNGNGAAYASGRDLGVVVIPVTGN